MGTSPFSRHSPLYGANSTMHFIKDNFEVSTQRHRHMMDMDGHVHIGLDMSTPLLSEGISETDAHTVSLEG